MVAAGETLNGRYRLDRVIGTGGFGQVFLGTDLALQRQVALKVASPRLAEDRTFLSRFAGEAQRVAALDHPNILPVWDYGRRGAITYLVMPYVAGGTLQGRLDAVGALSLAEASALLAQAAAALDYAHERGIVHRDVKPLNILLRPDGHLFLADFGIAKVLTDTNSLSLTQAVGTIAYMAPEQFDGRVGRASDIYALGCVLFQMLANAPPFVGSTEQVLRGHLLAPVPSLAERSRGRVPTNLQWVIEGALAKAPEQRFRTAGELARAVRGVATGAAARPIAPPPPLPPIPPPATSNQPPRPPATTGPPAAPLSATALAPPQVPTSPLPRRGRSRGRIAAVAAAVVLLAAIVVGALAATRGGPVASSPATATVAAARPAATATATRPAPTATRPPPTVTPTIGPGSVLYQADWSQGLNGWRGGPDWAATGGLLANDGGEGDFGGWIAAPFQPGPGADYAVEAEVQVVRPAGCGAFGVGARIGSSGGYWGGVVSADCGDGNVAKLWSGPRRDASAALAQRPYTPGRDWHTYRLEVQGTAIRLYLDGALVAQATDGTFRAPAQVGLFSTPLAINVRSFRVIAL